MGNNHDKYFGKDKRKILILGLPSSGKTTLIESLALGNEGSDKHQKTKDLLIKDVKIGSLVVTLFDLAGGERQRIFWKQHFQGTQGIIFLLSCTASPEQLEKSWEEIGKLSKVESLAGIPIAVCLNKSDLVPHPELEQLSRKTIQTLGKVKMNQRVFGLHWKNEKKRGEMMGWLLSQTKAL